MKREQERWPEPARERRSLPKILAPVSLGELLDKITILEIKCEHCRGESHANVQNELQQLQAVLADLKLTPDPALMEQLRGTNRSLWRIEDQIRAREQARDFGAAFIELARSVYQQNDRRAAIKRQLNLRYGSALIEEKSYTTYE